jgi:hypothetical protein
MVKLIKEGTAFELPCFSSSEGIRLKLGLVLPVAAGKTERNVTSCETDSQAAADGDENVAMDADPSHHRQ